MNAVIIEPSRPATASIIWLHGLGANGHDFEPIVPELPDSLTVHTRFIFPHAPYRPISINGGMVMPGWYDVVNMDLTVQQDVQGTRESEQILQDYIAQEIAAGIPAQRIVLAGFSQGGAIALHTGLRYPHTLAGIMALSSYLPLADTVAAEIHLANRNTSIFMGHGEFDPVIPLFHAKRSQEQLKQLGYSVKWYTYPIEHGVNAAEITQVGGWLNNCLP